MTATTDQSQHPVTGKPYQYSEQQVRDAYAADGTMRQAATDGISPETILRAQASADDLASHKRGEKLLSEARLKNTPPSSAPPLRLLQETDLGWVDSPFLLVPAGYQGTLPMHMVVALCAREHPSGFWELPGAQEEWDYLMTHGPYAKDDDDGN